MEPRHVEVSEESLLPIGDAARRLGVSVDTMRRWSADGRIPVVTLPNGHRRYRAEDIDQLLKPKQASA